MVDDQRVEVYVEVRQDPGEQCEVQGEFDIEALASGFRDEITPTAVA